MSSPPRGAVVPGTVGRLTSNRLVLVERVTAYAAYLLSLPEQGFTSADSGDVWDARYVGAPRAVCVNPWVTIEPVPLDQLSELNRKFVESGGKLEVPVQAVKPASRLVKPVVNPLSVVKRGGEKRYIIVHPDAVPSDHRAALIKEMVKELTIAMKGAPNLDEVVHHALKHEKFSSPSSHRAIRWFINDLVKNDHLQLL